MHLIEHDIMNTPVPARTGCLWTCTLAGPLDRPGAGLGPGALGPMVVGVLDAPAGIGLALLEFGHGPRSARGVAAICAATGAEHRNAFHPLHAQIEEQLAGYAHGVNHDSVEPAGFDLSVHLIGTAFQRRVWRALLDIPPGTTTTYQCLGVTVGCPGGSRAVGGANGANRVGVVVPCHRVIASDGTLGGYGGGLGRKKKLLEMEGFEVADTRGVGCIASPGSLWST